MAKKNIRGSTRQKLAKKKNQQNMSTNKPPSPSGYHMSSSDLSHATEAFLPEHTDATNTVPPTIDANEVLLPGHTGPTSTVPPIIVTKIESSQEHSPSCQMRTAGDAVSNITPPPAPRRPDALTIPNHVPMFIMNNKLEVEWRSVPITPVTPTFDMNHSSPASSQSSLTSTPTSTSEEGSLNEDEGEIVEQQQRVALAQEEKDEYELNGDMKNKAHRTEWNASRSAQHRIYPPGTAIKRLGPSIMFGLFDGL